MAWRCSGQSNVELISNMVSAGIIRNPLVQQAMAATDRGHYTSSTPYSDSPQSIPRPLHIQAHATISAPHVHALALEVMAPFLRRDSACRVLDVGCGSGYLLATLHRMIDPGLAVGVDHMAYLTQTTRSNLSKDFRVPAAELAGHGIVVVEGDGRRGVEAYAPYDAIHVGAAAASVPSALVKQLKAPGIMFVPVGEADGNQFVYLVEKDEAGNVTRRRSHGVRYVPLTDAES